MSDFQQLPLNIKLRDDNTFANFYIGNNQLLIAFLKNLFFSVQNRFVYLWGDVASGKSHLLQAACNLADQQQKSVFYLPLKEVEALSPVVFENADSFDLICIDDLEFLVGDLQCETALFNIYNKLLNSASYLIVSTNKNLSQLSFKLPDLRSRLAACINFNVKSLSDEQKISALQLRAKLRGFTLTVEVGNYLLTHSNRDLITLIDLLNQLDLATLSAKKRLTIPFIKQVLKE